jgi:hypothetical protein
MIIHFLPIFGDFSIKSYEFAPKYFRNVPWAKVQTRFIFHNLPEYSNLDITLWGKRIIGDSKD